METEAKTNERLGVTFNGSVTFGGPMFDIHDNEHVHIGVPTEPPAPGSPAPAMPDELTSAEAVTYWQRLRERGFVDAGCLLMPSTTRKQAMLIAELFAERLHLKAKWKPFEAMWGIRNLAQEKWDIQQTGSLPARCKEIEAVFDD